MYSFNDKVFLVDGAYNSCFYDFNKSRLYHCSADYSEVAKKAVKNDNTEFSAVDKEKIKVLLEEKLLVNTSEFISDGKIQQLKKEIQIDFVWIELTNQCNMKCIHCYDEACITNKQVLSIDEYKYIIDELDAYGVKKIQLIGGEPLLVKNLKEMICYACEKMDSVVIFTNTSLITDELAQFFSKHHISVAVSVYSYDEHYHDYVTKVQGSHKRTIQGLALLKKYNVSYRVANVLMNGVEIGSPNSDLYCLKNGDVVRLTGRANGYLLNDELIKKRLITQKSFPLNLDEDFSARCVSGHNCFCRRLYISSNMEVYPCAMERRISHGNLKGNHLKFIMNKEIFEFNKDKVNVCKDCEFRYTCFDCRPNSIEKEINEKPWYCTYNPYSGEWETVDSAISRIHKQLEIEKDDKR